jgi:hypothetical protein
MNDLDEALQEPLWLLAEQVARRGGGSVNGASLGIRRGSKLGRRLEAAGLVFRDEARSGSYLLGVYYRLSPAGEAAAVELQTQYVPDWTELRCNYSLGSNEQALKPGDHLNVVDADGVRVCSGRIVVERMGDSTDDRVLIRLRAGGLGEARRLRIFSGNWQLSCPCAPVPLPEPLPRLYR